MAAVGVPRTAACGGPEPATTVAWSTQGEAPRGWRQGKRDWRRSIAKSPCGLTSFPRFCAPPSGKEGLASQHRQEPLRPSEPTPGLRRGEAVSASAEKKGVDIVWGEAGELFAIRPKSATRLLETAGVPSSASGWRRRRPGRRGLDCKLPPAVAREQPPLGPRCRFDRICRRRRRLRHMPAACTSSAGHLQSAAHYSPSRWQRTAAPCHQCVRSHC